MRFQCRLFTHGYEAMRAIRSGLTGDLNTNIPIIVVTADITPETKDRVFEIGADDYLTKPIDKKLLYQKIGEGFFYRFATRGRSA